MSRKVYCYYECPAVEQIPQKLTAGCEMVRQRAACQEFAKKMGWDIVGEIEESGVTSPSASHRTSEGLPQLGALPDLKNVDILLVFMFDRLIHNVEEIPTVLESFAHDSVAVWSAMEGEIRGGDHTDRLMRYISFGKMHLESRIDTMQNLKFKTCIINGQERYIFATMGESEQTAEMPAQMFPESLLSFMDLDMSRVSALFSAMNNCMASLTDIADKKYLDEFLHILETLAKQHIYFGLFRLDWISQIHAAQSVEGLKRQWRKYRVSRCPESLEGIQNQVKDIFTDVLDYDRGNGTVLEKAASYYKVMDGAVFSFRPQFMHFELWDDSAFAEVLYPKSIYDLISYHLQECIKRELRFRICKNCGRYFYMCGRNTAMYCYRPYDAKGHTCRRIAPVRAWSERNQKDEIFHEYRREYKRRFAWINAGKIERDAFYAWSKQAKEKKSECVAGIISYEDFIEWLRVL